MGCLTFPCKPSRIGPTIEGKRVGVVCSFPPQKRTAFSFFFFFSKHSYGQYLFCDAQGVRSAKEVKMTDPCLLSNGVGGKYGATDLGKSGIENWFYYHKCNQFCSKKWRKVQNPVPQFFVRQRSTYLWDADNRKTKVNKTNYRRVFDTIRE